jgi:hypothetical protein
MVIIPPYIFALGICMYLSNDEKRREEKRRKQILLPVLIALALSIAPIIKNFTKFELASGSSWLGLNLTQVAPEEIKQCGFNYAITSFASKNQPIGDVLNDPRIIPLSKKCATKSIESILSHPLTYIDQRLKAVVRSFSRWPNDYFMPPLNWNNLGWLSNNLRKSKSDNDSAKNTDRVFRALTLILNISSLIAITLLSLKTKDQSRKSFYIIVTIFIFTFLAFSHAFNGGEQERMRYTIHPILWSIYFFIGVIIKNKYLTPNSKKIAADNKG